VNAGQLAALIAAGFWAVLVCAAVFVLARLARLISASTRLVTGYRDRADALIASAQAAVDRTHEQLARTDAITASMDDVTANMAELSGHVSALAGLARGISAGVGAPLMKIPALAYGLRRAAAIRRTVPSSTVAETLALPAQRAAASRPAASRLRPPAPRPRQGTRR
jgi:hypothetical protein